MSGPASANRNEPVMTPSLTTPSLRPYLAADLDTASIIFVESIAVLTEEDYSDGQRAAWIATSQDEEGFGAKLLGNLTLIAELDGEPAGFATLKDNKTIDMLYVHPEFIRQKVATTLIDALERLATARGAKSVSVDASDTAKAFFEGRGYVAQQRNTVTLGEEWLGNTTMTKDLSGVIIGRA
jgi:putative acetyltransferase